VGGYAYGVGCILVEGKAKRPATLTVCHIKDFTATRAGVAYAVV